MRIMFASAHCLLDSSSGAALSLQKQLELLRLRGWECCALTGAVLDPEKRVEQRSALGPWGIQDDGVIGGRPIWSASHNGVQHTVLSFVDSRRHYSTAYEEYLLYHLVQQRLKNWMPDIFYCYGGWTLERSLLRLARKQGSMTCFMLTNNNYDDPDVFLDVDHVFTPTRMLAGQYRERLGIDPVPIGEFCDTTATLVEREAPRYVTFINPAPEKGVALFVEIARQALERLPELRFLVVQSRWTKELVAEYLGIDWLTLPNVAFVPQQQDMRAVYAQTRVLLFPTFWFEAGGRTLLEAQANGIPVLASSHGGIRETLAGGGFVFDIPERCQQDLRQLPQAADAAPWLQCLERLCHEPAEFAEASGRALAASRTHDIGLLADDLDERLRALLLKRRTDG